MSVAAALPSTEIERESKELRAVFVRPVDENGDLEDVTADPVEVAAARENTRPSTWVAAAWVAGGPFETRALGDAWQAELTIGGTGTGADLELEPGRWRAWCKVTTATEDAVFPVGWVTVH